MRPARKFPRYPLDIRVEITASGQEGTRHLWGLAGDIGEDGISATVSDQLSVGEAVCLKFGVDELIESRAIVRFHRGLFYGFEFLLLNEQAMAWKRCSYRHHAPAGWLSAVTTVTMSYDGSGAKGCDERL